MATSEITPSAVKLQKLVSRVADGDIKIPAFQRHFVWNQGQIIELLDSLYQDYPIGSILLWNSGEKLKATRNVCGFAIPDKAESYPVNYVLDGQQRLSTIYAVFCTDRTQSKDEAGVALEPFEIFFDPETNHFLGKDDLTGTGREFPLKSLFSTKEFVEAFKNIPAKYQDLITQLHEKFNNYEVPIVTITKRSKTEVGIIFERINSTGTKLTTLDLMVAWTWSENFHLQDEIEELLEVLDAKGFGELPEKTILQCLSAIIKKSTSTKAILELDPAEVHTNFPKLQQSLEKAIDFLNTQLHVVSTDFLPHVQQLIPLTFFFSEVNSPSTDQTKWLKQWFWKTAFSRRYSSQTDEKMDSDIVCFEGFIAEDAEALDKYSYSVSADQLVKQKFTRSSPLVRAFLLLLAQSNPLNLVNGNKIDLGKALSEYNSKEYHHVFPRAHLKKREFPVDKINSLVNFCFLPADSNKKISSKAPSEYFINIVPQQSFATILESNLLPLNKEVYDKNDFEKFLTLRSQRLIEFLDKQLV